MPALRLSIDEKPMATVCTDGYDLVTARVWGTRVDEEFALVEMSAGTYPEGGEPTDLTWLSLMPLKPGQVVAIELLDEAPTEPAGQSFDDMFPDADKVEPREMAFAPDDAMLAELKAAPHVREGHAFELTTKDGTVSAVVAPQEHGFGFTTTWHAGQPDEARLSVHTYSLESMATRQPGRTTIKDKLQVGEGANFTLLDAC
jgi:hypothetical protein